MLDIFNFIVLYVNYFLIKLEKNMLTTEIVDNCENKLHNENLGILPSIVTRASKTAV